MKRKMIRTAIPISSSQLIPQKAWRGVLQYMGKLYAFPGKGASIDTIKPDFMKPKATLSIIGDLTISSYDGNIRISSIVKEISEYQKTEQQK